MIRYLTAGESHGKCLVAIIEGLPSNLTISTDRINKKLGERQSGFGRGDRMKIETDTVEILSGVRNSKTLGGPVTLRIENRDWNNWKDIMDAQIVKDTKGVTKPRPGHADLPGTIKYNQTDIRNILERASARETAIRTAVGSVCAQLLEQFCIEVFGHVVQIGPIKSGLEFEEHIFRDRISSSKLRCLDHNAEERMIKVIEEWKSSGDSIGGAFEIIAKGLPIGLGSHVHWDRKLDARIAGALMSIQAIKAVEIGLGQKAAELPGSQVHDEIIYREGKGYSHTTNNSGGIEGGMTNGENVVVRAYMKPIPTLYKPLRTVDIVTKDIQEASIERSDACAVPAASVVGECVAAIELANAMIEKFAGDSIEEMKVNFEGYIKTVNSR